MRIDGIPSGGWYFAHNSYYAIWVTTVFLRSADPAFVTVGDGVLDYHAPPLVDFPAGRYLVDRIDGEFIEAHYDGPLSEVMDKTP